MRQDGTKAKSSLFARLPRISPVLRIILFVGIFLIIAIPLFLIYSQQQARQAELNQQYPMLEKALGALGTQESPEVLKKRMDGDLKIAQNELGTIKAAFPNPDQIPEIIDSLIELAKANGIEITKTQVATSKSSISVGNDVLEHPVVVFNIDLRGQVPKFQNFLLALNSKFPTSELKVVNFKIPAVLSEEAKAALKMLNSPIPAVQEEEPTVNVVLNVYSREIPEAAGGEISVSGKNPIVTFTDKKDKTTDIFKIKGNKWRIDWKATASDAKWSGITLIVYRKGETGRYIDIVPQVGGNLVGTSYIYERGGEFYMKVVTANISNWEIKIYE
jgi:hypothetical protein